MKKIISIIVFLGITFTTWAQGDRKHEVKLDALGILAVPTLELSYEYAMNMHSGVGIATSIRLDPPSDDYESFSFTPYYRQYFYDNLSYGNQGFFIEDLLQYTNGKDENKIINQTRGITDIETYNDIGIGFGGGAKWTTPNGLTIEAVIALGRNFKLDENSPDFFLRWGINLGYRFL